MPPADEEREIVITVCDADRDVVHVFTDSTSALSSKLRRVAASLGAAVTAAGEGVEFDLPLNALSIRTPTKRERTEAQRAAASRLAATRRTPVSAL